MIARLMENQLTFLFCIFAFHQVNSFEFMVQLERLVGNTYIPFIVKQTVGGTGFEQSTYEVTFTRDVSVENDMIIKYSYVRVFLPDKFNEITEVPFCGVDPESKNGGTIYFIARAMGMSDKSCPIKNGTKFTQNEYFTVDTKEFPGVGISKKASSPDTYLRGMIDKYEFIKLYVHVDDQK